VAPRGVQIALSPGLPQRRRAHGHGNRGEQFHRAVADVIREAKDRADIEVLIWQYAQALDNIDVDAYPYNHTYKGRAEIRKLLQELKDARAAPQWSAEDHAGRPLRG
jgi:hypothetical protein